MQAAAPARLMLRLTLARATAWALLIAGWVGLGSFALVLTPGLGSAFALVALWLLALGAAASVATGDAAGPWLRRAALMLAALLAASALFMAPRGAGLPALLLATLAWAGLTALASGVVRSLRLVQRSSPQPPIGAASLGALCAALVLGDLGDLQALALRLGAMALAAGLLLALLQRAPGAPARAAPGAPRQCRAGLFDCSLPAWPAGAWSDAQQWPTLLAGLAMLPMMAALPLMVAWCRADMIAPQTIVALHLAAMFAPALLLRRWVLGASTQRLSALCALCLGAGALAVLWLAAPWNLLVLATLHGAAWGLAWAGQLWSPGRRSQAGTSPWRAALVYAVLTVAFGVVVQQLGAAGVAGAHAVLGVAACLAWLVGTLVRPRRGLA